MGGVQKKNSFGTYQLHGQRNYFPFPGIVCLCFPKRVSVPSRALWYQHTGERRLA